jgi:leucyl-tRNA synthetase
MSGEPFYITTAIAYPNGRPHIGHAYEAIATDAMARFQRLMGRDVRLVTGTDEHGLKMVQTARQAGRDGALHLDRARLDPFKGHCMRPRDHSGTSFRFVNDYACNGLGLVNAAQRPGAPKPARPFTRALHSRGNFPAAKSL